MVKLTADMMEIFKAAKYFPLATASRDGNPNVVPVGSVYLIDPETIWIGNQFMNSSIKNVQENPRVCLYAYGPETKGCLKIKADVAVHSSGPDYEKMKDMVKARRPELVCRSLLVLKITEVYNCKSGADSGKRML
jgi:predicted pyridoxine 5'-phosphate oxidase superfamily flavin-nucleotide-binding protein